jgi:hypothetical protein
VSIDGIGRGQIINYLSPGQLQVDTTDAVAMASSVAFSSLKGVVNIAKHVSKNGE